jgi:hypothetical protein
MDQQHWDTQSTELFSEFSQWRKAHPKATYREIEKEVHDQMMQVEAQVIQELARESPTRVWGRGSEQEAPACPHCGTPLHARGQHPRTLQGNGGESVTLKRTYGTCPSCGLGLFPPR